MKPSEKKGKKKDGKEKDKEVKNQPKISNFFSKRDPNTKEDDQPTVNRLARERRRRKQRQRQSSNPNIVLDEITITSSDSDDGILVTKSTITKRLKTDSVTGNKTKTVNKSNGNQNSGIDSDVESIVEIVPPVPVPSIRGRLRVASSSASNSSSEDNDVRLLEDKVPVESCPDVTHKSTVQNRKVTTTQTATEVHEVASESSTDVLEDRPRRSQKATVGRSPRGFSARILGRHSRLPSSSASSSDSSASSSDDNDIRLLANVGVSTFTTTVCSSQRKVKTATFANIHKGTPQSTQVETSTPRRSARATKGRWYCASTRSTDGPLRLPSSTTTSSDSDESNENNVTRLSDGDDNDTESGSSSAVSPIITGNEKVKVTTKTPLRTKVHEVTDEETSGTTLRRGARVDYFSVSESEPEVICEEEGDKDIFVQDMDTHHLDNDIHVQDKDIHVQDKDIHAQDKDIHVQDKDIQVQDKDIHAQDKDIHVQDKDIHVQDKDILVHDEDSDPFSENDAEFLSVVDEIIDSQSPTQRIPTPRVKQSLEIELSPNVSPSILNDTPPSKNSPRRKVTHTSPLRHLRAGSSKRLFQSPTRSSSQMSQSSQSNQGHVTSPKGLQPHSSMTQKPKQRASEMSENFHTILNTVMTGTESGLFSSADFNLYRKFLNLSTSAVSLYLKLYQRTLVWYRQSKITYGNIAADLSPFFDELHKSGFFTELKDEATLPSLETLLDFLDQDEMKSLAKQMNVNCGPQSGKLVCKTELLKMAKTQRTLSRINCTQVVSKAVLERLGGTFRISDKSRNFCSRIFIIFSLPQYWEDESTLGSNLLLTMTLAQQGKMEFPYYRVTKSRNIFRNHEHFVRFSEGISLHTQMQANIESKRWADVAGLLEIALEKLKACTAPSEQNHDKSLPGFLRVYTAGTVLTRAVWLGIEGYQKLKQFEAANEVLTFLLNENPKDYLSTYRGRWHERRIINAKHLKLSNIKMKEYLIQALSDPFVLENHLMDFSARLDKIRQDDQKKRKLKSTKAKQRRRRQRQAETLDSESSGESTEYEDEGYEKDDKEIKLKNPNFRTFKLTGTILERSFDAEKVNVAGDGERVYGKSTFLGGGSSKSISSVEGRALDFYMDLGYRFGIHGEGSVPVSIFGLIFWDLIYADDEVPDVFRSPYQSHPLDLNFDDFYNQRQERIEELLRNLRYEWSLHDALAVIEHNWNNNINKISIVIWNTFHSLDQVKRLVTSMGLGLVASICEKLARNFRFYRSGFPDLIVWNETECAFVEVKGPGDKLSMKQTLWLHYLISVKAKAEVCRVNSVSNKRIRLINPNQD